MSIRSVIARLQLSYINAVNPHSIIRQIMQSGNDYDDERWISSDRNHVSQKILKRRFDFAGCDIEMAGRVNWNIVAANEEWHKTLYSFRWLNYLKSNSNNRMTGSFVREFVNGFITESWGLKDCAYDVNITGERLGNWINAKNLSIKGGSKLFHKRFSKSIIKHFLFMNKKLKDESEDLSFPAIWGIIVAASNIKTMSFIIDAASERLSDLLHDEIMPDGMHISCSPEIHIKTLQLLVDIRDMLDDELPIYSELNSSIEVMGDMLRLLCHGDGRLALFGDTLMGDKKYIAAVIEASSSSTDIPVAAQYSGLFRLSAGKSTAIIKAENPVRYSDSEFRGDLSFEFSYAAERIIVNCGSYRGKDEMWKNAVKRPAAFSTLSFDVDESTAIADDYDYNKYMENDDINIRHDEDSEGSFIECNSDFFMPTCKVRHSRYLRLSKSGDILSGQDVIDNHNDDLSVQHDGYIRFHLHPDIRCRKEQNDSIILTSLSGVSWVFTTQNPSKVTLEESIYLGYYGKPQRTQQMVIRPALKADKTTISWSLTRV